MQNNPFRKRPGFYNDQKDSPFAESKKKFHSRNDVNKKEKEWGLKKFTPVVRTQAATPWAAFKNELIQKQQEERQLSKYPNSGSEETKIFLRKRQENFRRMQIEEAKKEDTKWEDFSEDLPSNSTEQKIEKKIFKNKKNRKNSPKSEPNIKPNALISEDMLKNFDSKKLNFHQNNIIRKVITRTTHLARGSHLDSVVKDLKRRGVNIKS